MNRLALIPFLVLGTGVVGQSGSGQTTRYWDCCKPSCSWNDKANVNQPVLTCDAGGNIQTDPDLQSGCGGGNAFTCTNMSPFAVDENTAYGFAAVNLAGSNESAWCCECYQLTFTDGPVAGKRMIVQATNTGSDLGSNHFDILIPGGGLGIFTDGCPAQFGSWNGGQQYGGVSSREECSQLPSSVVGGCEFRFDWFQGADNPNVEFQQVQCPAQLVEISGCARI